jgi:type IV pilus assembly protein PilQ
MRKWKRLSAAFFIAASSVYSVGASAANPAGQTDQPASNASTGDIKVVDTGTDLLTLSQPVSKPRSSSAGSLQQNADGTFTLTITHDADIVQTLRLIGAQAQKSIIPSREVKGTLQPLDLYNVTFHEALDAIVKSNGCAWREDGAFIYVYSTQEMADIDKASRSTTTEVFHTFYTAAANALVMIKPVLSTEGQVAISQPAVSGIDEGSKDAGGNSNASEDTLVVTDYPENIERVRKVLKEIDRRPQQILLEATIMSASLNENNSMGVNFTAMGGVDFSTLTGGPVAAGTALGGNVADALDGNILNDKNVGPITDKGYAAGSVGGNGLQVGLVKNNIAMFINALEGITDTTILANPKVLALNKQKGEVIVGREDGYLTTTVTDSASVQTVQFLETGTRLIFRPYIGDDGYIRMEIHPEDSSGGLGTGNLPYKVTTETTSNIMVKDGHTIVIGGLFRESTNTTRSQVPFLGNLPIAGYLFRSQTDTTVRQEIIILLTPHIVKDDNAYSDESEKEMKDAEQIRVGARRGMMPFGRERLAESDYEQAVKEMRKEQPDRQKALWYLDSAINLNPRFLEAIQMKQDLTGQVLSTADNSSIRSFVTRAILADNYSPLQPQQPTQREVPIDPAPIQPPAPAPQTSTINPPTPNPSTELPPAPVSQVEIATALAPAPAAEQNIKWDWQLLLAPWTDWLTHSQLPLPEKIKSISDDQPTVLTEASDPSDANR